MRNGRKSYTIFEICKSKLDICQLVVIKLSDLDIALISKRESCDGYRICFVIKNTVTLDLFLYNTKGVIS